MLLAVATAAQPAFNPAARKDRLRFLISILGGEIDPEFAGIAALLGTSKDGCPLADPHLVVPGDLCGGRQISGITRIRIRSDDQLWNG
ncbi:hypothetical protein [Herbidospora mongoliensis]|uniref:hypothetical protein n=1 Tax=Herbidospora mongoliensis TaxID=688067 RepID=UPI000836EB3C|nr:hypothetical protein [Herbidospora mongoliensis]